MNGFIEKLYSSFIKNRENACIKTDGKTYSYREILQLSENIRHQIKDIESKNIGIYLTDDVYMYASILAVWFEGRTYVPIHPDFPLSKNLSAIEQAEIKLIPRAMTRGSVKICRYILKSGSCATFPK